LYTVGPTLMGKLEHIRIKIESGFKLGRVQAHYRIYGDYLIRNLKFLSILRPSLVPRATFYL
jgi:hypothetical protein